MSASILAQAQALLGPGEAISGTPAAEALSKNAQTGSTQEKGAEKIIDVDALNGKLEEIRLNPGKSGRIPWVETLAVSSAKPLEDFAASEDVKREEAFAAQAKELAAEGYRRLRVMKIPATRPQDFLAEMFKTDEQMLKVRGKITDEQKRIGIIEERRRNQANAKFGKQTGIKRQEMKAKEKKKALSDIQSWKERKGDDEGKSLEAVLDGVSKSQKKSKGKGKGKGGKGGGKGKKGGGKGSGRGGKVKKGGKKRR